MNGRLSFGEYVRRLRRGHGWQLGDAAARAGVSSTHLSRIENDNAVPNAETVVKLATALDGELEVMLQLADCLPKEILERLLRRSDIGAAVLPRAAQDAPDDGFAAALIGDIDPKIRSMLAIAFEIPDQDVNGLYTALQSIARMEPSRRKAFVEFIIAMGGEG